MLLIKVQQGSPQWTAHRANHFNASECAAMFGVCPYKTRDQLLHEKKTGIQPEVNHYKKALFARGHQCETWARPLAEKYIGEELFPCVGVLENSQLSASFDGLTMDRSLVWEHKLLSKSLREIMQSGDELPLHYRLQLEQQLLVSGADKAVFMASAWSDDGELIEQHDRDYFPDLALRQKIIHGWQQFASDLADYVVKSEEEAKEKTDDLPILPALYFEPKGDLSFSSNVDRYKQHAFTVLASINRNLVAENDFATAEQHIKWCKTSEDQLTTALDRLIIQTADFNYIFSTLKTMKSALCDLRLDLDKQVRAEKTRIKNELINAAIDQVKAHYQEANIDYVEGDLLVHRMESAIKGLKNLDKMQNAIDRVVVEEKTAFTQRLESGELTRLISLKEINAAIAPLMILQLSLFDIKPVASDGPTSLYKITDFYILIQKLMAHLATAKLAEPLAHTA